MVPSFVERRREVREEKGRMGARVWRADISYRIDLRYNSGRVVWALSILPPR